MQEDYSTFEPWQKRKQEDYLIRMFHPCLVFVLLQVHPYLIGSIAETFSPLPLTFVA